jgi:hypothetical protein
MDVAYPPAAEVGLILLDLLGADVAPGEYFRLDLIATVEEKPRSYGDLGDGNNEVNAPCAAGYVDRHPWGSPKTGHIGSPENRP